MSFWDFFDSRRLLAAHRGYRAIRPENTLSAFEASIGKCDLVELDVGFSQDGVPIIIHDDTLERTTNAARVEGFTPPYRVVDYPYAALARLDTTSIFLDSDPFGSIAKDENLVQALHMLPPQRIPTFRETLLLLRAHKLRVNVEIKDMSGTPFDSVAVAKTLEVITSLGMEQSVILSSFNHVYMQQAKAIAPQIARAALQEDAHHEDLITYLRMLDVGSYHANVEIVDEQLVQELSAAGIVVNVFTVNDLVQQKLLYDWGVRAIFSDYCRESINEIRDLTSVGMQK